MQISAVIITKNSGRTLERCLESLSSVADEIILVDSGSTDNTLEIADRYHCKLITTEWLGYGKTKNIGHYAAKGKYVLSIDSDEVLSTDLIQEILTIKFRLTGIYGLQRLNNYCGRWIKHGAWYPDKKIRLFPRTLLWNNAESHEQLIIPEGESITYLKNPLLHYAYNSKEELKSKAYLYAKLGALDKKHMSKSSAFLKMIFSPIVSFIKSYLIKRGFLDGRFGFEISYYIALGTFLKYKTLLKS